MGSIRLTFGLNRLTMSPLQSEAAKEFRKPRPSLPPPDRKGQPGKSSPMMETFSEFSMVGVYETRKGLKFVHITSEKFAGKFTVLIFMDNRLTELEAEEWKSFNDKLTDFKAIGAQVVGVCTDSHVTVRTMLMNSASLKGIKFPIICDRDGDFSRAFGVLKLSSGGNFGAARAVAVLDPEKRLIHLRLHNERTRARPDNFLQLLSRLQGNPSSAKKPSSFASNTPTVSFAGSDAVRKNDAVENESAKKEEKEKPLTSSKSATRQPTDLKEENLEAEKVPSKTMKHGANCRSTGAELKPTKTPSNTPQAPKAPGSESSKTRSVPPMPFGSVSRPGSNLTPRKPSSEVPTNKMETPSKNLAGAEVTKKDAKATRNTIDKSLEKPPKNLKPGSAVADAKADVKKKPAAASNQ